MAKAETFFEDVMNDMLAQQGKALEGGIGSSITLPARHVTYTSLIQLDTESGYNELCDDGLGGVYLLPERMIGEITLPSGMRCKVDITHLEGVDICTFSMAAAIMPESLENRLRGLSGISNFVDTVKGRACKVSIRYNSGNSPTSGFRLESGSRAVYDEGFSIEDKYRIQYQDHTGVVFKKEGDLHGSESPLANTMI